MLTFEPPTETVSERIADADLKAACDAPLAYIAILHRYLDGGLTGLSASAQRVFLQLVRETLARGRKSVRVTIRCLVEQTGFSKETVRLALRTLASPEVDLINVVSSGGAHAPGHYEIRWFTFRKSMAGGAPVRTRLRADGSRGSIETRLSLLTVDEKAAVQQSYLALQLKERREIEERVRSRIQELGLTVDTQTFNQLLLCEVMRVTMYHYIKRHHANAFDFDPVKKNSPLHSPHQNKSPA